jgi:hypothetical protein
MGSLVPVLFDRFRAPKAMVQKIHFDVQTSLLVPQLSRLCLLNHTKQICYARLDFRPSFRPFFSVLAVENLSFRTGLPGLHGSHSLYPTFHRIPYQLGFRAFHLT